MRRDLGRLCDRVVKPATIKRYRIHVGAFFTWVSHSGRRIPAAVLKFDTQLCAYAECLWEEGDQKSVLANVLSGLAHFVPALRGHLPGPWRLYHAWSKSEPTDRAPPCSVRMTQAIAGVMLYLGHPQAAVMTLVAFHCLLRTGELLEVRTTDCGILPKSVQLRLRDTKIGSRLGITEDVLVDDAWLVKVLRRVLPKLQRGATIVGESPHQFRLLWRKACKILKLPDVIQPYGLRRGGATAFFQRTGSFSKTADRGRWASERAMKTYVTSALQEIAAQTWDDDALLLHYAALLNKL